MTNLEWIAKGNTGCVFATLFAKNPSAVGWKVMGEREYRKGNFDDNTLIISIIFNPERYDKNSIRHWALNNGFYTEMTSRETEGLRIKCDEGISWVQYFGPDSHVPTRRTPLPMLMFTRKLNKSYYVKVGFKGLLHLAHAWYSKVSDKVYDLLWERSYQQTKKKLGQSPDITQAAKTTWLRS